MIRPDGELPGADYRQRGHELPGGGAGCVGGLSASDSCSGTNGITLSQSPAAGTCGMGVHVIKVTATDAATNSHLQHDLHGDRRYGPTVICPARRASARARIAGGGADVLEA